MVGIPRLPGVCDLRRSDRVINHQYELIVMIAVLDVDIDPGVRHPARDQAELTGHRLPQSKNGDLADRFDVDPSRAQNRCAPFGLFADISGHQEWTSPGYRAAATGHCDAI